MEVVPRIVGSDGKHYPIFRLTQDELEVLWSTVHRLRHEQRLTIQGIQDYLEAHGVPRSRGSVANYLNVRCDECPEHSGVGRLQAAVAS